MKQTIKINESQLRQLIRESIMNVLREEQLDEVSPQMAAAYANGRLQQMNGQIPLSQAQQRKGNSPNDMQQKVMSGVKTAQDKWNKQYGYSYDHNNGEYGEQKMGGGQFTNGLSSPYSVNSKHGYIENGHNHTMNTSYNPSTDKYWSGRGNGESNVYDNFVKNGMDLGDNGAYRAAREMDNAKWPTRQQ